MNRGTQKAIELEGVTKRYGEITAVDDISLAVERREGFGFIGPNGAGKSTTINILMSLVSPTSGRAEVLGYDVSVSPNEISKRTGVLPEGIRLSPKFTAREHLRDTILNKGASDDPVALLERVGIADAIDRRVSEFSTGMRQRLGLALALVGEPELLILDEPSAGLDPNGIRRMQSIISAEIESGTTVFFSSHILPQVEAVCDRAAIINGGEIVAVGDIDQLQEQVGRDVRIQFELREPPNSVPEFSSIGPAVDVELNGRTLSVSVTDPAAKSAVVRAVDERYDVADFHLSEVSLDSVFGEATDRSEEELTV